MSETEPQPFYTVTDEDKTRRPLVFEPHMGVRTPTGFKFPSLTRNLVVDGRAVTVCLPLVDLGDHMVAVPINVDPPAVPGETVDPPAFLGEAFDYANTVVFSLQGWCLSDLRLGVALPMIVTVDNPHGPAMRHYLHRYLVEARPRGLHVAQAWGEAVLRQQREWAEWSARRAGSVDGTVVDEPPVAQPALPAGS
ncbi:MAG: hypothetical protein HOY78_02185 [Saccharothrix sp.]|nr:hypothetical protein [Saccharothrix sp.]